MSEQHIVSPITAYAAPVRSEANAKTAWTAVHCLSSEGPCHPVSNTYQISVNVLGRQTVAQHECNLCYSVTLKAVCRCTVPSDSASWYHQP